MDQAEQSHHETILGIDSRVLFAAAVIAILAITVYARMGLVGSQGLFEPDGFFYYSVIRATINSHLSEPQHLGISGFSPNHNFIGEAPGLPYLTVIFYILLGWTGASALEIMRWLPVLVAIIEVVLAYFLAKELSDSRLCGLLAMFFVAVSAGNIARTAALVYRGDTFIAVPLMLALLIMLKGLKLKSPRTTAIYAVLAAFIISTGGLIWNGSPYIVVVYMLSLTLLLFYSFVAWKPELTKSTLIFIGALFSLYILQSIYLTIHGVRSGLALTGLSFLAFYIPLLLFAVAVYYIVDKKATFGVFASAEGRYLFIFGAALIILLFVIRGTLLYLIPVAAVLLGVLWMAYTKLKIPRFFAIFVAGIAVIGVLIAAFLILTHGYVSTIASASGVGTSPPPANATNSTQIAYAVGSTTQELQKPTFSFLYASFGLGLYLVPIGIILFLLLNRVLDLDEQDRHVITVGFIALLSYLVVTAYLQYNAIRYNALVSIPIAIFAAYGLYGIVRVYRGREEWAKRFASISFVLAIAACTFYLAFLLLSAWHSSGQAVALLEGIAAASLALFLVADTGMRAMRKDYVGRLAFAIAVAMLCGYLILQAYRTASLGASAHNLLMVTEGFLIVVVAIWLLIDSLLRILRRELDLKMIALGIMMVVIVFSTIFTVMESYASTQADGINPSFLSAMSWMRNNTPSSATVLALWPDGSVVEGWANRTSYMDSVGGENAIRIYYFARYLANDTPDSQYLYSIGKPQYLVARQYWLTELTGLIAEGVPKHPENYVYTILQPEGNPYQNATAQVYIFTNGIYNVTLVNRHASNSTALNYTAYLSQIGQRGYYKIHGVTLYNTSSTRYLEFNASAGNYQLNYTLMIFYSGTILEGAIITTDTLYNSNLFKLVWLCNRYQCPVSNSTTKLVQVYSNNDTRIYRINYT
ncbi:MAG: hypothetical protein KGH94_03135 [Candidatus Micrarchaeota archaeon]|nr:hypothetical protein [Candidatus Micrarchaeota archaeon]